MHKWLKYNEKIKKYESPSDGVSRCTPHTGAFLNRALLSLSLSLSSVVCSVRGCITRTAVQFTTSLLIRIDLIVVNSRG